jgi:hypothetical protein
MVFEMFAHKIRYNFDVNNFSLQSVGRKCVRTCVHKPNNNTNFVRGFSRELELYARLV